VRQAAPVVVKHSTAQREPTACGAARLRPLRGRGPSPGSLATPRHADASAAHRLGGGVLSRRAEWRPRVSVFLSLSVRVRRHRSPFRPQFRWQWSRCRPRRSPALASSASSRSRSQSRSWASAARLALARRVLARRVLALLVLALLVLALLAQARTKCRGQRAGRGGSRWPGAAIGSGSPARLFLLRAHWLAAMPSGLVRLVFCGRFRQTCCWDEIPLTQPKPPMRPHRRSLGLPGGARVRPRANSVAVGSRRVLPRRRPTRWCRRDREDGIAGRLSFRRSVGPRCRTLCRTPRSRVPPLIP